MEGGVLFKNELDLLGGNQDVIYRTKKAVLQANKMMFQSN